MKASIITIGDEILIGQIVDTNSVYIAKSLNSCGIVVNSIFSIGDEKNDIADAINKLMENNDIVIVTGGLGPTNDDITKNVLCEIFDTELVLDTEVLENIKLQLEKKGIPVNENNYSQAMIPKSAKIIKNTLGTAPGMLFYNDGRILISLPGVPFEMKGIFERELIPYFKNAFNLKPIIHKTVLTTGLPESILAEKLSDWEGNLPSYVKLAYLPSPGFVRLRLSVYNVENGSGSVVQKLIDDLCDIIPDNILATDDKSLETVLGEKLLAKKMSLSTAESCTGGKIAKLITSVAGSSNYFMGSVVAYSNSVKENLLNVSADDIKEFGAVSKEVVEQMAAGVRSIINTDYAIATSGVAGPGGGSLEKPVGTIWIAIASKDNIISKKFNFFNDRETNILRASNVAMTMLIEEINKKN